MSAVNHRAGLICRWAFIRERSAELTRVHGAGALHFVARSEMNFRKSDVRVLLLFQDRWAFVSAVPFANFLMHAEPRRRDTNGPRVVISGFCNAKSASGSITVIRYSR